MAAQWQKNVITAVHYDVNHKRIESFHVRQYSEGKLSNPPVLYTRKQVLDLIDSGQKFVTATPGEKKGTWSLGEEVRAITSKSGRYLRTDNNQTEADNLGDLAEF